MPSRVRCSNSCRSDREQLTAIAFREGAMRTRNAFDISSLQTPGEDYNWI
jgi:hypothetical protein